VAEVVRPALGGGPCEPDPARDRLWGGYSGYFQDLDGHLWEVAWNPAWQVGD
jgi:predicted lactoylglutathione lyase